MIQENNNLPPYLELLKEAGRQINKRKWLLLRRTLVLTWPVILFILGVFYFLDKSVSLFLDPRIYIPAIIYVVLMAIYLFLVNIVFFIEKIIWIDSYFDGYNLESSASWRIAKKLFWPVLKTKIRLTIKYYVVPIFIVLVLLLGLVIFNLTVGLHAFFFFQYAIPLGALGIGIYFVLFIRVELRYFWMIFLDHFGRDGMSFDEMVKEMEKVNEISQSASFKKSLVIYFGTDIIESIARSLTRLLETGAGVLGKYGRLGGSILGLVLRTWAAHAASLGRTAAIYMIYKLARKEIYGKEQEVNQAIYKM